MQEDQVLHIFVQILLALHFCHTHDRGQRRVIHRDLKPENGRLLAVHISFREAYGHHYSAYYGDRCLQAGRFRLS